MATVNLSLRNFQMLTYKVRKCVAVWMNCIKETSQVSHSDPSDETLGATYHIIQFFYLSSPFFGSKYSAVTWKISSLVVLLDIALQNKKKEKASDIVDIG